MHMILYIYVNLPQLQFMSDTQCIYWSQAVRTTKINLESIKEGMEQDALEILIYVKLNIDFRQPSFFPLT